MNDARLERARMAAAEVGIDPANVLPLQGGGLRTFGVASLDVWRLSEVSRLPGDKPRCWTCRSMLPKKATASALDANRRQCLADRPLVRDCGLVR